MKTDPRALVVRRHWVLNNPRGQFEDRSVSVSVTPSHSSHKKQHAFKIEEAREANSRNLGGGSHKTQWHTTGGLCSNGTSLRETSVKILFLPLSICVGTQYRHVPRHIHRDQSKTLGILLYHSLSGPLETKSLTKPWSSPVQQASAIFLSVPIPPQSQDMSCHKCAQPHQAFTHGCLGSQPMSSYSKQS